MRNLLLIILTALLMTNCGESSMEKDASKLAKLTWEVSELSKKIASEETSGLAESTDLGIKLAEFAQELKDKYTSNEDKEKFNSLYLQAYSKVNGSEGSKTDKDSKTDDLGKEKSSDNQEPIVDPATTLLQNSTQEILKSNFFTKMLGMTGFIAIHFDGTRFTFKVIALGGDELCKADGTYQILPAIDESIACIKLFPVGPVQKSPYYADKGVNTELFLHFNQELLLKRPTKELISHFGLTDLLMMEESDMPKYFLIGRDAFSSERIYTRAERDSIAMEKRKIEEKKRDLEEKLKGL